MPRTFPISLAARSRRTRWTAHPLAAHPFDSLQRGRAADLDPCPVCRGRALAKMTAMTYGYERNVERRIRLWIARQERNQRKSGQPARFKASRDTPGVPNRTAADIRQR